MYSLLLTLVLLLEPRSVMVVGADWCGPCHQMDPYWIDPSVRLILNTQYTDVYFINYDKQPEVIKEWNVKKIPTVIIIEKGKKDYKEIKRYEAYMNLQQLKEFLKR